ncbi:MAG: phage tail sheath C-terminal domain-containing protein [Parvibaculum sp.]|nr:phage tail sheath C-terminal domain-containing protein [Parvibaculum sp.]
MAVSFPNIPSGGALRVPLFYADVSNAAAFTYQPGYRALLIGQMLAAGTADALAMVSCNSADQARTLFGQGSQLARMVKAFRDNDALTEIMCIALDDDGSGADAEGTVTVSGTTTAAGTIALYIGGQLVSVGVASGVAAAAVATAIGAAVNANAELPVTATVLAGEVTLTAKNAGTLGNGIDVRTNYRGSIGGEATPAGIALAIVAMASGATDPDIADAITAMGDSKFNYIVQPYALATELTAFQTEMNDATGRWSYARQLYGHVFTAKSAAAGTLLTFGGTRNDQHGLCFGYYDSPTPTYEAAAMFGGRASRSLSDDPARPLQTLELIGFLPPPETSWFTLAERNALLFAGIATSYYVAGRARIERAVTMYRVNEWGQVDPSYLDVETLATLAYILDFLKSRITQKFPRHKLANDGTRFGAGQAIVTPSVVRGELIAAYSELESLALVENVEAFKANLIVERDATDPSRVNVLYPPDLVNGLRVFALLAEFRLEYAA